MKYDLIVVGTGFASSFFLKKYLEKNKNKKVLVLERGNLFPLQERLNMRRGDARAAAEISEAYKKLFINHHHEKIWKFSPYFGGSSNCWWACTPRFMPNDFKMKSVYGIEEDWPLTYEDLDPYYEEAEDIMSISGPKETPFPRKKDYPLPPHLFAMPDRLLHKKYGTQYISQPTARASRSVKGRNQCAASATCTECPVNAKFTIENAEMGVYENPAITVEYNAQAYRLSTTNNAATRIHYVKDHIEREAEANYYILGANPFFNINILLNSGDKNPLTGRGFGEQLGIQALIDLKDMSNAGGSTWVNANGYMLYDGAFRKDYAGCLIETDNAPYIRLEEGKWLNRMSFRLLFEDLPQNENYITTSANKLVPQAFFNAGRAPYALKAFEEAKKKLPGILDCLPVEQIQYLYPHQNEGHIIGGSRMGTSIKNSVVDKYLVHHQYRNVLVLGAGSFTTYSPANPTLTLCALSMLAADHLF